MKIKNKKTAEKKKNIKKKRRKKKVGRADSEGAYQLNSLTR